jgi:hypothetical protein
MIRLSYGMETHSARTDRHTGAAAAEDTTRSYGRSEAHDLNTASKHRREAALGYDHEAVSYGIGDAQRTHGQGTRTPRSGGHYAFLWEKQAHDTNTASKQPQRGSTRI